MSSHAMLRGPRNKIMNLDSHRTPTKCRVQGLIFASNGGLTKRTAKASRMRAESLGHIPSGPIPMPLRALLYRRPSEPHAIEGVSDGAMYLVRVSRPRRARRYTLRIHAATREVVLTIPPRGNVKEAKSFAERHGGWIAARLGRLPEAVPFVHGTILPLRNVNHRIVHLRNMGGPMWRQIDDPAPPLISLS